ncbi:MAG: dienelactone hydrolase family protein [Actinomycetota bacterium]
MREIAIPLGDVELSGDLAVPGEGGDSGVASGVVLFAHGTGSSRHSPRNRLVADTLRDAGLATLLMDLLTETEEVGEARTGHLRFDIGFLARRLVAAIGWLGEDPETKAMPIGLFGASTGAAAALVAAAQLPDIVGAVVSRGGRPDLARNDLGKVRAPTLLIVGGADRTVLELNREALEMLAGERDLEVVPGASHLFEEPGALEHVASSARDWFVEHL